MLSSDCNFDTILIYKCITLTICAFVTLSMLCSFALTTNRVLFSFGFVDFADEATCKSAAETMQDADVDGRNVKVDFAAERGSGGGGGGFGGGRGGGGGGGFRGQSSQHLSGFCRLQDIPPYSPIWTIPR